MNTENKLDALLVAVRGVVRNEIVSWLRVRAIRLRENSDRMRFGRHLREAAEDEAALLEKIADDLEGEQEP